MSEYILVKNQKIFIDAADYAVVCGYKWHLHKGANTQYARGYTGNRAGAKLVYMHRLLCNSPSGLEIDHINGNGLDNRRVNLRIVDRSGNNLNRSKVSGCYYEAKTNSWRAELVVRKTRYKLGRFQTKEQAHEAYLAKKFALKEHTLFDTPHFEVLD